MSKEILGYYIYANIITEIPKSQEKYHTIIDLNPNNLCVTVGSYICNFFYSELDALKFNQKVIEENLKKHIENANKELSNIQKRIDELLKGNN